MQELDESKKYKVAERLNGHHFGIGEIVSIEYIDEDLDYKCTNKDGDYWYLGADELEVVNEFIYDGAFESKFFAREDLYDYVYEITFDNIVTCHSTESMVITNIKPDEVIEQCEEIFQN